MAATYSVSQAQTNLPRLLKDVSEEGSIVITRRDEAVAYLVSRERMEAIAETLELMGNPAAMSAIRDFEAGQMEFLPLSSLDEEG